MVKNWFRLVTDSYKLYQRYAGEVWYQIGKQAIHELKMKATEAVGVLGGLLNNEKLPPSVRFRVASYILEKAIPFNQEDEKARRMEIDRFFIICERLHISDRDWEENYDATLQRVERVISAQEEIEKIL